MKQKTKILLVGNIYDKHICRLVKHISSIVGDDIQIDIFNTNTSEMPLPDMFSCYGKVFNKKKHFPRSIYKLPKIGGFFSGILDTVISFNKLNGNKYDLVNIHFVTWELYFAINKLKRVSSFLMLSPWGSDVYRIGSSFAFKIVNSVFKKTDFVSAPKIKFREDIKNKFAVPESKFIELGFGSSIIDEILRSKDLTKEEAKRVFNINGKYVITCGYNGSEKQNHAEIINAIYSIKNKIKEHIVLIIPMTYGANSAYINKIRLLLDKLGFDYLLITEFLSDQEVTTLRKCSDIFIHAQPTDAFSASVQEYLLTDTIVINGKWTRYPDLEKYGVPYYIFNSFEELGSVIIHAYDDFYYPINSELRKVIENQGWNIQSKKWAQFYSSVKYLENNEC